LESSTGSQKQAHKKTILHTFMDPTLDIDSGKSHDRLLRVRYFPPKESWNRTGTKIHNDNSNDNLLKLQGLFAALISFNVSQVSLVVLQCTGIRQTNSSPPTYLDAAPSAEISLPETRYEVTGQILSLVLFAGSDQSLSWAWTTEFVSFESVKTKQAAANTATQMGHLSITLDGRLVLPLISSDIQQVTLEEILKIPPSAATSVEPPRKTWVFPTHMHNISRN
jgi:hypothetical protein